MKRMLKKTKNQSKTIWQIHRKPDRSSFKSFFFSFLFSFFFFSFLVLNCDFGPNSVFCLISSVNWPRVCRLIDVVDYAVWNEQIRGESMCGCRIKSKQRKKVDKKVTTSRGRSIERTDERVSERTNERTRVGNECEPRWPSSCLESTRFWSCSLYRSSDHLKSNQARLAFDFKRSESGTRKTAKFRALSLSLSRFTLLNERTQTQR